MPWFIQILVHNSDPKEEKDWRGMCSNDTVYEFSSEEEAIKTKNMSYPDQVMHENSVVRHKFLTEEEAEKLYPKRLFLK